MGALEKSGWLRAFRPHIYFDDSMGHCTSAAPYVSTAQVLYPDCPADNGDSITQVIDVDLRNKFLLVCRGYLKTRDKGELRVFEQWYDGHLATCVAPRAETFMNELSASVQGTPIGLERRAAQGRKDRTAKLVRFLDQLYAKLVRPT